MQIFVGFFWFFLQLCTLDIANIWTFCTGGCNRERTKELHLPERGRPDEPRQAAGADPGQRRGASRPVGSTPHHQPGPGQRHADPFHQQGHAGTSVRLLGLTLGVHWVTG